MLRVCTVCKPRNRYREVLGPVDWPLSFPFYWKHISFETCQLPERGIFFSVKCRWTRDGLLRACNFVKLLNSSTQHFFSLVSLFMYFWKVEIIDTFFLSFHFIAITPSKCGTITPSLTLNFIYIRRQISYIEHDTPAMRIPCMFKNATKSWEL